MSYIGKSPAVGNFVKLDAITTSSTNTYNLTVDSVAFVPESANHMLVSLNGVIQAPLSSFSVSGSTITFIPTSGTLSSSDSIDFIMVYGNVLDIGTPSDSTVTNAKTNFVSTSSSAGLQIKGDGTTDGTLQLNCSQNSHGIKLKSPPHSASASYTLTFPNNDGDANEVLTTDGSGGLSWASAGGTNTPGFLAYLSSSQNISNTTATTLVFQTEVYDTNSAYDTSNGIFTVPSGQGGRYYFTFGARASNWNTSEVSIYLEDQASQSRIVFEDGDAHGDNNTFAVSGIADLSAGNTVKVQYYQNGGGTTSPRTGVKNTWFGGFKLIE